MKLDPFAQAIASMHVTQEQALLPKHLQKIIDRRNILLEEGRNEDAAGIILKGLQLIQSVIEQHQRIYDYIFADCDYYNA
jgi:hypothetical protein